MKKNFYIIIVVIIIIVAGAGLLMSGNLRQPGVKEENNSVLESTIKEVSLTIDNGGGSLNTINSEFKQGTTALDLLKEGAERLSLPLKIKNYDIGVFIE